MLSRRVLARRSLVEGGRAWPEVLNEEGEWTIYYYQSDLFPKWVEYEMADGLIVGDALEG